VLPVRLSEVCKFLRDDPRFSFDSLMCQSGVDYGDGTLGSVYHLCSTGLGHKIVLRVVVPKEKPSVPSVANVWASAGWMERETYDLFGIVFEGHPDLRRILLPDDWVGYPLRKDYRPPDTYNGMKVTY
jgi:NADH-quinone oxidoreductase subunit C